MNEQKGLTRLEVIVIIVMVASPMWVVILKRNAQLTRVKKRAMATTCLMKLSQWGLYFNLYTDENEGRLMEGFGRSSEGNNDWIKALGAYHKYDSEFACCPRAIRPWLDENRHATDLDGTLCRTTTAWGYRQQPGWLEPMKGSYGINNWVYDLPSESTLQGYPEEYHWRSPYVKSSDNIPLFLDCLWLGAHPECTDSPPIFNGQYCSGHGQMFNFCRNRHDGFVNSLFLDGSVRKVGLKELWTLKWHRSYDILDGPWNKSGGVQPEDWPQWMRGFKDY